MGRIEWFRKHRYATPGPYFCEDQELLLRTYGVSRFGAVDKVLFAYRVRGKNNWRRVAKARWTFFRIQFRHFSSLRQYRFVSLASLVLVALATRDLLRMVRQVLGLSPYSTTTNPLLSTEWHDMLEATLKSKLSVR